MIDPGDIQRGTCDSAHYNKLRSKTMDNHSLMAYGLYPPEMCEGIIRDFSKDTAKKLEENDQELREELERILDGHIQRMLH